MTCGCAVQPPAVLRIELLDHGGTIHSKIGRNPAAERLTADHRLVPAECLENREHVIGVVLHLVVDRGFIGPTVPKHVDGDEPEMIGMRPEVSGIRLGVTADAVQRQDERFRRVA